MRNISVDVNLADNLRKRGDRDEILVSCKCHFGLNGCKPSLDSGKDGLLLDLLFLLWPPWLADHAFGQRE
jgi:hypothetical protein